MAQIFAPCNREVLYINPFLTVISYVAAFVFSLFAGFFVGVFYRKKVAESAIGSAEIEALNIVEEAKKDAEAKKKEILLEAKEESIKVKNEAEKEAKERRNELQRLEKRLLQKEEALDRKSDSYEKKEETLQKKIESLDVQNEEAAKLVAKQHQELERISGFTSEQAKDILIAQIVDEAKIKSVIQIKEIEQRQSWNQTRKHATSWWAPSSAARWTT